MTPKEKAKELIDKMSIQTYSYQPYAGARYQTEEIGWEAGKKCALIAVDEILESYKTKNLIYPKEIIYYEEVKQEIKKL